MISIDEGSMGDCLGRDRDEPRQRLNTVNGIANKDYADTIGGFPRGLVVVEIEKEEKKREMKRRREKRKIHTKPPVLRESNVGMVPGTPRSRRKKNGELESRSTFRDDSRSCETSVSWHVDDLSVGLSPLSSTRKKIHRFPLYENRVDRFGGCCPSKLAVVRELTAPRVSSHARRRSRSIAGSRFNRSSRIGGTDFDDRRVKRGPLEEIRKGEKKKKQGTVRKKDRKKESNKKNKKPFTDRDPGILERARAPLVARKDVFSPVLFSPSKLGCNERHRRRFLA